MAVQGTIGHTVGHTAGGLSRSTSPGRGFLQGEDQLHQSFHGGIEQHLEFGVDVTECSETPGTDVAEAFPGDSQQSDDPSRRVLLLACETEGVGHMGDLRPDLDHQGLHPCTLLRG